MSPSAVDLMSGALAMAYATCALFFFRFWRQTNDRLFAMFGVAFALLAAQRLLLRMIHGEPLVLYAIRLVAFVVILVAIWDRNRKD